MQHQQDRVRQVFFFAISMLFGVGGYLNDLWMYNITSNRWTWLSGNNSINSFGSYGIQGIEAATNWPGGRDSYHVAMSANLNAITLFGGYGYAARGSSMLVNSIQK